MHLILDIKNKYEYLSVVAERSTKLDWSSDVVRVCVWVWVQVMTQVCLSKTLNHYWFILGMGRKAVMLIK